MGEEKPLSSVVSDQIEKLRVEAELAGSRDAEKKIARAIRSASRDGRVRYNHMISSLHPSIKNAYVYDREKAIISAYVSGVRKFLGEGFDVSLKESAIQVTWKPS